MTLEDFFTLTEMKDGLTAPSRVHELVAVMQKEKDCVLKNIGDATRQWAAVASTIAATENKDCLDLFIQLDGLWFIDRWLRDAQNFGNDATASDSLVEESITVLLRALEKLQIDKDRSVSSGIWITVNNLLGHNSFRVQDRARALFDSWKQGKGDDAIHHDAQVVEVLNDSSVVAGDSEGSRVECIAVNIPPPKRSADAQNDAAPASNERAEDAQIENHNNETLSLMILEHGNLEDRSANPLAVSVTSNSVQENFLSKEKSPASTKGGISSIDSCSVLVSGGLDSAIELGAPEKLNISPEKSALATSEPCKLEPVTNSTSADAPVAEDSVIMESSSQRDVDAKEGGFSLNTTTFGDVVGTSISTAKDGECCSDTLQDSSGDDSRLQTPEDRNFLQKKHIGVADDDKEHSSDIDKDFRNRSGFSTPAMDALSPDLIDKRSETEPDDCMVDALEVARQVAQEVEREVVDYREPSCSSSSEKSIESGSRQPGSPDSTDVKRDPPTEDPPEDVPTRETHSLEAYPKEEGCLKNSDNVKTEVENGMHELESSQVTEVARETDTNTEKGLCDFDLNQEVCTDDMVHPFNPISTPISIVSSSRSAASGLPLAPLQFEGNLGWKGSAVTSAFRPASPRKISDGDRALETAGTGSSSRQRRDFLNIDLNVAEDDDKVMDLMPGKVEVQSTPLSGESSLEMGPREAERLNLDLNRISNDSDAPPSDLRMEGQVLYPRNGCRSPSPASSSSSLQPSMRNFDLNDRPLIHYDFSDQGRYGKSSQNASASSGSKSGDPVISIMGTRVEVGGGMEADRKDFLSPTPLPNGKALDLLMDANMHRMGGAVGMVPAVSYTHSAVIGYNGGLATPPTLSISSSMYGAGGSIAYLGDSRGAPVVPQVVGSASALPSAYSQTPFIMSLAGTPLGLTGVGPSRPNFDLNSGSAIEGSTGGLRQFLTPCQGRQVEEQLASSSQPSSSSAVAGKRKEPDGGWEPYPLHLKHPQSPWR